MSSEVLIRESTNVNSFAPAKSYKKGEVSSFNDFIGDATKDREPKTEFKNREEAVSKNQEYSKPKEDSSKADRSALADERTPAKNSREGHNNDSQDGSVNKSSEKVVSEEAVSEEAEPAQDGFAAIPVAINIVSEGSLNKNSVTLEDFDLQEIDASRDITPEQSAALLEKSGSFDMDFAVAGIEGEDLLKAKEIISTKTLPLTISNQQNATDLSGFSSEEQVLLLQMGKEVAAAPKPSDFNSESFVPLAQLEEQSNLLSKSVEFESRDSSLIGQIRMLAATDSQKQTSTVLEDNLLNKTSSDLELTDIDGFSLDAALKQKESRNAPIARKEIVKIAGNKESIGKEPLFDQDQISFDELEISDFAVIDNSKAKTEVSFSDSSLSGTSKTTIRPQEQLSLSLKYAVSQGKSEITINLYPKALGAIDVKIEFATNSSGQSEVQKVIITADRNSTLKLLESTKSHLETALAELKKEAASTVTDTSKKEASLQFDMRGGNNGQPDEGYFGSFNERENWMNKFRNLTTSDDGSATKPQEGDSVTTRKNIHNSTTVDIEV